MSNGSTKVLDEKRVGELIDQRVDSMARHLEQLAKEVHTQTQELTKYVTVIQRNIQHQESTNTYLQRIIEDHAVRISQLEVKHAVMEHRVPAKLVDPEQIAAQGRQVDELSSKITKYAGIAIGAMLIVNAALGIVGPMIIKAIFGIGG